MPNLRRGMMAAAGAGGAGGGELWAWGQGAYGSLGVGNTTNYSSPVQVGALEDWLVPGSGYADSAIVKTDGSLWGAGYNETGVLGQGNTTAYSSPVQVGSLTDWFHVKQGGTSSGTAFAIGIKTDGTLWSWGYNNIGQLGLGNTTSYSSPVQVGSLTDWKGESSDGLESGTPLKMSAGSTGWHIIKDDGTLWKSGFASSLGGNSSSPVQVGSDTDWVSLSQGVPNVFEYATKSNNTLYAWGGGQYGRLMHGDTATKTTPLQVGSLTDWAHSSSAGDDDGWAIKTDGTTWACGRNEYGGSGQGNTTAYSSPVQVGSLTDWALSFGGSMHGRWLKTDGTMWTVGRNNTGQLAQGNTTNLSSPVQVGSITNWGKIVAGQRTAHATKV